MLSPERRTLLRATGLFFAWTLGLFAVWTLVTDVYLLMLGAITSVVFPIVGSQIHVISVKAGMMDVGSYATRQAYDIKASSLVTNWIPFAGLVLATPASWRDRVRALVIGLPILGASHVLGLILILGLYIHRWPLVDVKTFTDGLLMMLLPLALWWALMSPLDRLRRMA